MSPHISWGCVTVCLAQFVSQSGPLVYRAPFLIPSAPPNASNQCVMHRSIITYCMWMSWEMSRSPLISLEKSQLKVTWAQAGRSRSVGVAAVDERKLFRPLTWMNCWSNAEACNRWIVYINMINIALINQISVIYCCFSHLALTRKLWRTSAWSVQFLFVSSYRNI